MTSPRGHYAIAGAIVFAVLVAGWMGRYSFEGRAEGVATFILDRWSGQLSICVPTRCTPLFPRENQQ